MYTVIARRYRPQNFDEVVGQEPISETLKNAIAENRIAHAYLFVGPRGVGKTSMARIFAKSLNYAKGPTSNPCGKCEPCKFITEGSDIDVIEIDGASNRGIDNIRALRENALYTPLRSKYKIYIVDEFHMLTTEAFNAFLKTLEEPPEHVKFIFATTEPQKMPDTIVSRCQRFDFRRISSSNIAKCLQSICKNEKVSAEDEALFAVARMAKGSLRDSESILDQLISYCGKKITAKDIEKVFNLPPYSIISGITESAHKSDLKSAVETVNNIFANGYDPGTFLDMLIDHLRNLMIANCNASLESTLDVSQAETEIIMEQSKYFTVPVLLYYLESLSDIRRRLRDTGNPKMLLEIAVIKMAQPPQIQKNCQPSSEQPKAQAAPAAENPAGETESGESQANAAAPDTNWANVLSALKEKKPQLVAYIKEARPEKISESEFILSFPHNMKFHREQLEDAAKKQLIEDVLYAVYGRKLVLKTILLPAPARAAGSPGEAVEKKPAPEAEPVDPDAQRLASMFNGTIVKVNGK